MPLYTNSTLTMLPYNSEENRRKEAKQGLSDRFILLVKPLLLLFCLSFSVPASYLLATLSYAYRLLFIDILQFTETHTMYCTLYTIYPLLLLLRNIYAFYIRICTMFNLNNNLIWLIPVSLTSLKILTNKAKQEKIEKCSSYSFFSLEINVCL